MKKIDLWIGQTSTDRNDIKYILNGDFNMSFLESWSLGDITNFLKKSSYRNKNNLKIASAKEQAQLLLELTEKHNLTQMVKDSTRNLNILDLIFTDYPAMIGNIDHIKHNILTDHDTLLFKIYIENFEHQDNKKVNFCSTKIPN